MLLVLLIISFLPQDEYIKDITINSLPDKIGVWHEDKNAFNNEYLLKPFYNADFFQVKTYQNKKNKDSLKLIFAYYKNIRKDAWLHTPEICVKNSGGKMVFKKYIKIPTSKITVSAQKTLSSYGLINYYQLYWHQVGRFTSARFMTFRMRWISRINSLIRPKINNGLFLIRIASPYPVGANLKEKEKYIFEFVDGLEEFILAKIFY